MTVQSAIPAAGSRRAPVHPDVTEQMIEDLVRHFYAQVRRDSEIGPIFEKVIPTDWEPHLNTMMDFWSSVMLMSGRFKGRPMQKHLVLDKVRPDHFDRWLDLFRSSTDHICPPDIAALFMDRAEKIAASLSRGMFGHANRR